MYSCDMPAHSYTFSRMMNVLDSGAIVPIWTRARTFVLAFGVFFYVEPWPECESERIPGIMASCISTKRKITNHMASLLRAFTYTGLPFMTRQFSIFLLKSRFSCLYPPAWPYLSLSLRAPVCHCFSAHTRRQRKTIQPEWTQDKSKMEWKHCFSFTKFTESMEISSTSSPL